MENLTREVRQVYRIPSDFSGVIISEVADSSDAAKAGFSKGDIITQIEDVKINSVENFNAAMKKYRGKQKRFLVYQDSGINTIVMK